MRMLYVQFGGKLYKKELIVNNHISFVELQEIGTYEDGLFNLEVFNFAKKEICLSIMKYVRIFPCSLIYVRIMG